MDRDRVEILYRTHGGLVYRRALRMLGDPDAAEAAVQEVFVRVLRRLDRYREEERVQHWLFRITTNYCLDQRRIRARRPIHVDLPAGPGRCGTPGARCGQASGRTVPA